MPTLHIPMPLQIILDDVGWWSGRDDSARNGPYRTGIPRDHVPSDYAAVIELGRRLRMKPQAATILCEWDTQNILRELPSATWQGKAWDNKRWVGPWLEHAAQIMRDGRDHFELVLHGLAHEHWDESGKMTRAEFCDEECNIRPPELVEAHLDLYARLLDQHKLGPFPTAYAPTAAKHRFGSGAGGLEDRMARRGIRYIATPFVVMGKARPTELPFVGVDSGVLSIDRGWDLQPWFAIDAKPDKPVPGPICGLHWPNILHLDPRRNLEVVDRWVAFFRTFDRMPNRMLSPDTPSCWTQFAYSHGADVKARADGATIDCGPVDKLPNAPLQDAFTIKVEGPANLAIDVRGAQTLEKRNDPAGNHVVRVRRAAGERVIQVDWRMPGET
ncbi:MAG: hypothetical protein NTW19_21585 [Planctomycetota bacterium]|nr:hypothetical protein [Planctomycetota bacterium]